MSIIYERTKFVSFYFAEIARDHFRGKHKYEVIGGVISPVHDLYSKAGLVAAHHRSTMVKLSLQTSDWIRLSDWEAMDQEDWTRTRVSLQYHQVSSKSLEIRVFLQIELIPLLFDRITLIPF